MPDRWICFDVNGTLLDPGTLARAWGEDAGRAHPLIFAALQEAVFAAGVDAMTGELRPLPELLGATLARRARLAGLDPACAEQAVALAREMDAYPDAAPALDALADAGFRLAAVTNSTAEAVTAALGHAGLLDRLAEVVGIDEVGRPKPHPDVYAHALRRLGAEAEETWFVAGHWWDVTGAKRAGLRTAWVAREERELLSCAPPPDVSASDLRVAAADIQAAG
ncbi:MAG: HAD-IA family hydrolase [Solirubrobacterales bacterium]|nr:HAD-IA family hydrolase [Solirubrobacterales bacterium]